MKNLKYIIVFMVSLFLTNCSLDINTDPNETDNDKLKLKDILPVAIYYTAESQYNIAYSFSQYSQHLASYFSGGVDTHGQTTLASAWVTIYLKGLSTLKNLEAKANEENALHYRGVAKVLIALNLGMATDSWGDVPYSDAFKPSEPGGLTPEYDTQQVIYTTIQTLLGEAITDLQATDASAFQPGTDDLVYGGNLDNWIATAYTLRARYAIHLTKKEGVTAATNALSYLASAYGSNGGDFQLEYNDRNFNPWYANVVLAINTGNFTVLVSDQLVSLMNGTAYAYTNVAIDPRLPEICTIGEDDTEYIGGVNGTAGSGANTDLGENNFYTGMKSPIVLVSYAEAKFIEAEAQFLANGGTATSIGTNAAGYAAYIEGITANMDKLEANTDSSTLYLSDPLVDVGMANLTMELIMKEKFIAMFLNPESFTDYRRYDFDPNVFNGLELPEDHDPDIGGLWVRRANYPSSEFSRNGDNVEAVAEDISVPVWWDN
jgi:hypothetical protein